MVLLATRVTSALVRRQVTGALVRYQGVRAPSFIVAKRGMPRYDALARMAAKESSLDSAWLAGRLPAHSLIGGYQTDQRTANSTHRLSASANSTPADT